MVRKGSCGNWNFISFILIVNIFCCRDQGKNWFIYATDMKWQNRCTIFFETTYWSQKTWIELLSIVKLDFNHEKLFSKENFSPGKKLRQNFTPERFFRNFSLRLRVSRVWTWTKEEKSRKIFCKEAKSSKFDGRKNSLDCILRKTAGSWIHHEGIIDS